MSNTMSAPISANVIEGFQLSPQQRRLWLAQTHNGGKYSAQCALLLEGELDPAALKDALHRIVERHDILRTAFRSLPGAGFPLQVVDKHSPCLDEIDLRDESAPVQTAKIDAMLTAHARNLDFERGGLLRTSLLALAGQRHVLLFSLPALCADAATLRNFTTELASLYQARRSGADYDEDVVQYAQYAEWRNETETGDADARAGKEFWSKQALPAVTLPFESTGQGALASFAATIGQRMHQDIEAFANGRQTSTETVLLACWQILLSRLTGEQEIVVHRNFDGRPYEELKNALGLYAQLLPVPCSFALDPPFSAIARDIDAAVRVAAEHEAYFSPPNTADSAIGFEYYGGQAKLAAGGVSFSILKQHTSLEYCKLKLACMASEQGIDLDIEYDSARFDGEDIARVARSFSTLLASALRNPDSPVSALNILSENDRRQLVVDWNATSAELPIHPIHHFFEQQAARTPGNVALVCPDRTLHYAELNVKANQLAHHLRKLGAGKDTPVGLCTDRTSAMLIGVLGILKAGAAYVPLNPEYPKSRLAQQLEQVQASIVVTQEKLLDGLPAFEGQVRCLDRDWKLLESEPAGNPETPVSTDDLAYVIFTSGSTGVPKGVAVTHANLANYTGFICDKLRLTKSAPLHFATVTTLSADLGNTSIFPCLASGGCLHVIDYEAVMDACKFAAYVERHPIDVLKIVPSHFNALLAAGPGIVPKKVLIFGGEALSWALVQRVRDTGAQCRIVNHYGPTETTVGCLTFDVERESRIYASATVPIGRPIANAQAYVFDRHMQPAPIGVAGELYAGGNGVARGYFNQPAQTAERFLADPYALDSKARLYKTGDRARYLAGGDIEFLGRLDRQVKIRGFRLELGEIETALSGHPQVRENAVIAREFENGDKRLIAYIVARSQPAPTSKELRGFLKDRLPEHMLPASFVILASLPLNRNGKLDRNALPDPDRARAETDQAFVAPRTPVEEELALIWAKVLGIEKIGVHDNFFELGGDSILSIQIIARANQAGLRLSLGQLFQHQTIADLAPMAGATTRAAQPDQGLATGDVLLTPIQRWFFEQRLAEPQHFNQSRLLEVRQRLDRALLEKAIGALLKHHDTLRLRFIEDGSAWRQTLAEPDDLIPLVWEYLSGVPETEQASAIEARATELQASLNLSRGPLMRIAFFDLGEHKHGRLLFLIHHLAVDGVSYRILFDDLQTAYWQLSESQAIDLPPKTRSFKEWAKRLNDYARSDSVLAQRDYWLAIPSVRIAPLPADFPAGTNTVASVRIASASLDEEETRVLLQQVPEVYRTQINDVLLTALAQAIAAWTATGAVLIDLEGHGREEIFDGVDTSRTVGWFTTHFPVFLVSPLPGDPVKALKSVKEQLHNVPDKGLGYGLLRYLSGDREIACELEMLSQPELSFNYLGQFDQTFAGSSLFAWASESCGATRSPLGTRRHLLAVVGRVVDRRLRLDWQYSENIHKRETVEGLARDMMSALRTLIESAFRSCGHGVSNVLKPSYLAKDTASRVTTSTPLDSRIRSENGSYGIPYLPRRGGPQRFPLSLAQQRLWILQQFDRTSGIYNSAYWLRLTGALDVEALTRSLNEIVKRHESLRTAIIADGDEVLQEVEPDAALPLTVVDLSALPRAHREARMMQRAIDDAKLPFDITRAPLMRAQLIRLGDDEHVLLLNLHHIISDRTSRGVLHRELAELYRAYRLGKSSPLPRLPIQYADFAVWQRGHLDGGALDGQLAYWKRQLAGALPALNLPLDYPRPRMQNHDGGRRSLVLPASLADALRSFSRREGATVFMTLLAAFQLLLARLSGQEDILIGTPIAGRNRVDTEALVGFFIGTLVIRGDLSGNPSFRELLRRTRETALNAYANQDVPFERLVEELQPERNTARNPIFDVLINYFNKAQVDLPQFDGLAVEVLRNRERASKFDLTLYIRDDGARLALDLEYSTALFDQSTIARMLGHLEVLLQGIVAQPDCRLSDLPLLTPAERNQLLVEWNQTRDDFSRHSCAHRLFEEQANKAPDQIAVVCGDAQLSYRELDQLANQLANHLQSFGVGPEVLVAICVERSLDLIVGLLGVWKAGGAYVPLDPAYPVERLAFMLDDAEAPVLLTQQSLVSSLPQHGAKTVCLDRDWNEIAQQPRDRPADRTDSPADNLAYVIYTSGSTGKPKGVMIEHRSVLNYLAAVRHLYQLGRDDRVLQFASISFDVSVREIFSTLTCGAALVICADPRQDAGRFFSDCKKWGITMLSLPTAYWHGLATALDAEGLKIPSSLRLVSAGGEKMLADRLAIWRSAAPQLRLLNSYGPTETTVSSAAWESVPGAELPSEIPIGRALANTKIYILDAHLNLVPIGVAGELHIAGAGLARGYLRRPELTAEKFIPDPFSDEPGARLYKTGDLARYWPDGNIECLGRLDHQVKLRGYRIEVGEIEAVLGNHPAVRAQVVVAREDAPGDKRLVAYLVAGGDAQTGSGLIEELRGVLRGKLPDYMMPTAFVMLDAMPLTPNGKIDRQALPAPDRSRADEDSFVAPGTPDEEALAAIWAEVLKLDRVGIHDNFFELGGHSLLATQVISRMCREFNAELSLQALFQTPTVAGLAETIQKTTPNAGGDTRAETPADLDRLSDDEVDAMLKRLQAQNG